MKELSKKLNNVFKKAGLLNKYQIIIVLIFIFQFTSCQYFNIAVPYLDDPPYIFLLNNTESVLLKIEMCKNDINKEFKIDYSKSFNSLTIRLKIYCDKKKTNFIEIAYLSSNIIGAFFSYFFADYLGRKFTLLILLPIKIICYFLFGFCIFENYYFMMCLLIIIGFLNYIIMITILVYISEVIEHQNIPIFICLIISGLPISGMITFTFFNIIIKSWEITTIFFGILSVILYILIIFYLIESPIYNLLNGNIDSFEENIQKIANFNNRKIDKDDFNFLSTYNNKDKNSINQTILSYNEINQSLLKSDIESEYDNIIKYKQLPSNLSCESKMDIYEEKNPISKIVFGKYKMKDYTPIHLLKSKNQISNFLILTYIWMACLISKDAINYHKKKFNPNPGNDIITLLSFFGDFCSFYLILLFFAFKKFYIQQILVGLLLFSYILLSICLVIDDIKIEMILIYISEICWNCLYLLLYIITSLIYPSVLRTKGLSYNKGFGKVGTLMGPLYFRYDNNGNFYILEHLLFAFFSIVLSYGLPQKIGFFFFDNIKDDKNKEYENYDEKYEKIILERD